MHSRSDSEWPCVLQVEAERLKARLEERRQFPLEQRLRERVVGQEGPITTVSAGLKFVYTQHTQS